MAYNIAPSKQDLLVSGTNIKTINSNSLLGSGNLTIAGLPSSVAGDANKVLAVDNSGSAVWQYGGLGGGSLPSNTIVLGQNLPTGMTSTGTVLIGVGSGKASASGNNNTIIGSGSATSITNSASNVIIGQGAATGITTGDKNCVIGASAGASNNFNGVESVIIGGSASTSATGTIWATVIGYGARVGDGGVSLGKNSNSSGIYSTCLGYGANTSSGNYSVAIGYYSLAAYGFGANGGTNTVGVGSYTGGGSLTTGFSAFTRCLYLGTYAGSYSSGKTDEFMLDNQDRGSYANTQTRSLMYGTFNSTEGNQTLFINAKQTVRRTTSATSTVTPVLQLDSESSGTPANGIGVSLEMAAETAAGNTEIGVVLEAVTTDVTSTSEDFDLVVKNMAAGATAAETLRVASTGDVTAKTGNILIDTAGKGLTVKSGSNAKIGVTGAFPGGNPNTVTVSNTSVTSNSIILVSAMSFTGGLTGAPYVSAITASTSFVITVPDNSFTGTVGWVIVEQS